MHLVQLDLESLKHTNRQSQPHVKSGQSQKTQISLKVTITIITSLTHITA